MLILIISHDYLHEHRVLEKKMRNIFAELAQDKFLFLRVFLSPKLVLLVPKPSESILVMTGAAKEEDLTVPLLLTKIVA